MFFRADTARHALGSFQAAGAIWGFWTIASVLPAADLNARAIAIASGLGAFYAAMLLSAILLWRDSPRAGRLTRWTLWLQVPSIAVAGLAYELYGPARFVLGLSPETWDIVFRANIGGGFLVGLPATVSQACVGLNIIPLF